MSLTDEKQIVTLLKVLAAGFVVGGILITVYFYNETKGYPTIQIDDSLASKVVSVKRLRGDSRVHLETSEKFLLPYADNHNYQRYRLSEFINEGDLLIKKKGSDTLVIKRHENTYTFVIGKVINESN